MENIGPSLSLFYEFLKIQKITSSLITSSLNSLRISGSEPSFLTHNCSCRASELRGPKFLSGDPTTNNARLYRRYRLNFNPIPCPTYRTQVRRTLFDLSIVRRWSPGGHKLDGPFKLCQNTRTKNEEKSEIAASQQFMNISKLFFCLHLVRASNGNELVIFWSGRLLIDRLVSNTRYLNTKCSLVCCRVVRDTI